MRDVGSLSSAFCGSSSILLPKCHLSQSLIVTNKVLNNVKLVCNKEDHRHHFRPLNLHPKIKTTTQNICSGTVFAAMFPNPTEVRVVIVKYKAATYVTFGLGPPLSSSPVKQTAMLKRFKNCNSAFIQD